MKNSYYVYVDENNTYSTANPTSISPEEACIFKFR